MANTAEHGWQQRATRQSGAPLRVAGSLHIVGVVRDTIFAALGRASHTAHRGSIGGPFSPRGGVIAHAAAAQEFIYRDVPNTRFRSTIVARVSI